MTTIHCLPDEIILMIHDYVLGSRMNYIPVHYYRVVTRLMLVCKAWCQLIHERPVLWNAIYPSELSPDVVAVLLEKSAPAPLEVLGSVYEPLSKPSMELIARHAARWREVRLALDDENVNLMAAGLARSAGMLEVLGAYAPVGGSHYDRMLQGLLERNPERLTEMRINSIRPSWHLLKHLTVLEVVGGFAVATEAVVEALKASPRLIELYLSLKGEMGDLKSGDSQLIHLPELEDLTLSLGEASTPYVMSLLRIPLCDMDLDIYMSSPPRLSGDSSEPVDPSSFPERLLEGLREYPLYLLEIHMEDHDDFPDRWRLADAEVESVCLKPQFTLCILGPTHFDGLPWINQAFQASKFTSSLALRLTSPSGVQDMDAEQWFPELARLPNVARLDVMIHLLPHYENLIRALWPPPNTPRWPFPGLRQLVIIMSISYTDSIATPLEELNRVFRGWSKKLRQVACPLDVVVFRTNQPRQPGDDNVERIRKVLRRLRRSLGAKKAAVFRWDELMDVDEWLRTELDEEETLVMD